MNPFLFFNSGGQADNEVDNAPPGGTLSRSQVLNNLRRDFRRLDLSWEGKPDRDTSLDHHPTFIWADMQCRSYDPSEERATSSHKPFSVSM